MDEKHGPGQVGSSVDPAGRMAGSGTTAQGQVQGSSRPTGSKEQSAREEPESGSDWAHSAYEQGREMVRRASERYPEARRYLERGTRVVSERVTDAPLMSLLVAGAAGLAVAWMMGRSQSRSDERSSYRARSRRDYPGQRTGKRLIESDRVEGTAVYDRSGNRIGTIERVMLDKITGRAAYAVMSFGGFLGFGAEEFAVPWGMLDYDTILEGYRTNLTQEQLRNAPSFSGDQSQDWSDQERERQLHDYYQVTYYWLVR
jgi:hypothetical protein